MNEQEGGSAAIAQRLMDAAVVPIEMANAPIGDPPAYQVRRHLVQNLIDGGDGAPVGYKVGLTNPAMWDMGGVSEPIAGVLLAKRQVQRGATVNRSS